MPFADLLQWMSQSQKTGTLSIDGPRFDKKIYFRDGLVVAAASENPREFLSYYLVGWDFVAEEELQELLEMQDRHGTLLGELLVIIGRLGREEMERVLLVKTEEAIFEIFLWDEGEFRFLENILPVRKFHPLGLPVDLLVLEGVRRSDEWTQISEVIPDSSWVPRIVHPVVKDEMSEMERAILRELDGVASVEQLALACRVALFHVQLFVCQGLRSGQLELAPPGEQKTVIPGFSRGSSKVVLKEAERAVEAGKLLKAHQLTVELRSKYGDHQEVVELASAVERQIERAAGRRELPDDGILELAVSPDELTAIDCSPAEGFILSRIDGRYSVSEILQVVPGSDLEKRLMVTELMDRGLVRLRPLDPDET